MHLLLDYFDELRFLLRKPIPAYEIAKAATLDISDDAAAAAFKELISASQMNTSRSS